jgi:hypothetical protein
MKTSRIKEAIARVEEGERISVVARELEMSTSAIYAERKRIASREVCPCCGQVVRKGFEINKEALK